MPALHPLMLVAPVLPEDSPVIGLVLRPAPEEKDALDALREETYPASKGAWWVIAWFDADRRFEAESLALEDEVRVVGPYIPQKTALEITHRIDASLPHEECYQKRWPNTLWGRVHRLCDERDWIRSIRDQIHAVLDPVDAVDGPVQWSSDPSDGTLLGDEGHSLVASVYPGPLRAPALRLLEHTPDLLRAILRGAPSKRN